ncbi:MAG: fluoride efflux transporter CrcB [Pseudomonadota bacterium]|nr:fluoride efflux transporter CrcB [Pseudomonadota bacterium]
MIGQLCAVAAGGAVGSVARFLVAGSAARLFGTGFPAGTLLVNLGGSFLIGLLFPLLVLRPGGQGLWHLALMAGVLGGFTTFSAFSLETLVLLQQGRAGAALLNVAANVLPGLGAAWAGYSLARLWVGSQ